MSLFINSKFIALVFVLMFGRCVCLAQSTNQSAKLYFNRDVTGLQLTISPTNSAVTNIVVKSGGTLVLKAEINNATTNGIHIRFGHEPHSMNWDIQVWLMNSSGKSYYLTPTSSKSNTVELNPGEKHFQTISVAFGKEIPAGDYTLGAYRSFEIRNFPRKPGLLNSSVLKVQVR